MKTPEKKYCRIWLDSRAIPNSGIGCYVNTLLSAMEKKCPEYKLCAWKDSFSDYTTGRISPFYALCRLFYEIFILPFILKKSQVNIFHCTKNFGIPVLAGCAKILSVHDLIPLDLKEYGGNFFSKLYYYWNYRISCFGADKILCSSEYTKKRLLHYFPWVASKTQVVYLGAPYIPVQENQPKPEFLPEQKSYILMMGGAEPRKNICFAASCILKNEQFRQYELVIIGGSWHGKSFSRDIVDNPRVHCLENIPEMQLGWLYQHASVFIYPSIYEGFGLPVCESAFYNIPVLVANASCLPELLSIPEIMFEPENEEDFCQKLNDLLESETVRSSVIVKTQEQLQHYSCNRMISETSDVYRELLNRREGTK